MASPRRLSNEELKHLLARCLQKDEAAWETVFRGLYGLMKDVVLRTGLRDEDVEDAVSEAFLKLVHSVSDVAAAKNPLAYVGALARYTALRMRLTAQKRGKRQEFNLDEDGVGDAGFLELSEPSTQGRDVMAAQVFEALQKALAALRPAEAQLLRMKYVADYSHEEIAYIVAKDEGAVRVATHRAVKRLQELLDDDVRSMVAENPGLLSRLPALDVRPTEVAELSARTEALLEDYVADAVAMKPADRGEVERLLEGSPALRERKVCLEREAPLELDVVGHGTPEDMPRPLLERLMDEVRRAPLRLDPTFS